MIADDLTGEASHCVFPEFMGFMVLIFSVVYLVWNSCLAFKSRERCVNGNYIVNPSSMTSIICDYLNFEVVSLFNGGCGQDIN